jgi:hypothetical protein
VEYGEAVKKRWQLLEHSVVLLDENAFCIPASAPIETSQLQGISNDRMERIPIPYVKEDEALAEDLRLVVRLDAQSLFREERSETFLKFAQDVIGHGTTSSQIGSICFCSAFYIGSTCATNHIASHQPRRRQCRVISGGQFRRTGTTLDPAPTEVYPLML